MVMLFHRCMKMFLCTMKMGVKNVDDYLKVSITVSSHHSDPPFLCLNTVNTIS